MWEINRLDLGCHRSTCHIRHAGFGQVCAPAGGSDGEYLVQLLKRAPAVFLLLLLRCCLLIFAVYYRLDYAVSWLFVARFKGAYKQYEIIHHRPTYKYPPPRHSPSNMPQAEPESGFALHWNLSPDLEEVSFKVQVTFSVVCVRRAIITAYIPGNGTNHRFIMREVV